ncbi:MAG TPA: large-conductance mechanosensitive channel protein MscL [Sphingobacteriaceae bacterium]|nr:large-conductance mechanosensitive channel protein MscL [Sphingobacteriaceae bacterium]
MGLVKEFKEFAIKGNVIDLAVGLVIGVAFGKIVTSFVDDIIMPVIGYLMNGADFSQKRILLRAADEQNKITEVAIRYGNFINIIIQFVIVAFCVFLLVKIINKVRRKEQADPSVIPAPTREEDLLTEIRDLLKGGHKE